jgi:hypothetical protein
MPIYRMAVNITSPNASPAVNVWHFRTGIDPGGAIDAAPASSAVSAIRGLYNSYAPYYPAGASITSDGPVDVDTQEGVTAPFTAVAGSGTGGNLPSLLALCISWKTTSRTRRGTGRTFIGPLVPGFLQTDGTITDTVLTNFRTVAQTLVSASLVDNGWAIGVYGQVQATPKATAEERRNQPHVLRDIVSFTVKDRFSVMRSRRP